MLWIHNWFLYSFLSLFIFSCSQGRRATKTCSQTAAVTEALAPGWLPDYSWFPHKEGKAGTTSGPGTEAPAMPQHRRLLLSPWILQPNTCLNIRIKGQHEGCLPLLGISSLEASPSWKRDKHSLFPPCSLLCGVIIEKVIFNSLIHLLLFLFPLLKSLYFVGLYHIAHTYHLFPAEKLCFPTFGGSSNRNDPIAHRCPSLYLFQMYYIHFKMTGTST